MANLSPEQTALIERARTADVVWRTSKASVEARIRAEVEGELHKAASDRAIAAFLAFRAGVPKRQIGIRALSTSAPQTYAAVIESGRQALEAIGAAGYDVVAPAPEATAHAWRLDGLMFTASNGVAVELMLDDDYLDVKRLILPMDMANLPGPDVYAAEAEFQANRAAVVAAFDAATAASTAASTAAAA